MPDPSGGEDSPFVTLSWGWRHPDCNYDAVTFEHRAENRRVWLCNKCGRCGVIPPRGPVAFGEAQWAR